MSFRAFLRAIFAFVVGVSTLAMTLGAGVTAQSSNGFVMDARRTCDNILYIRWDARNVEKIDFTVTNTSQSWASDWIEASIQDSTMHTEFVDRPFDKVAVRATYSDATVTMLDADVSQCMDSSTAPWPSLDPEEVQPTPGGGSHDILHHEGSYSEPESGNYFEFLTAEQMCDDNTFRVTWTGTNVESLSFAVYFPIGGTDWINADPNSRSFTADIAKPDVTKGQAGVTFTNGDAQSVMINIDGCTSETQIPDAGVGDNDLRVQINMAGGTDISGSPFDLFAPVATTQFMADPYLSGFVGANNTLGVDGLIASEYRLVIYPVGMDPIEAVITVGNQPVTIATLNVAADGSVTVAYAAQPAPTPTQPADGDGASTPSSSTAVSGLPETGTGAGTATDALWIAVAASSLAGALAIRRKAA